MNLAANANAALYASMIVYTLAMLAFAWYLAARAPQVADSRGAESTQSREAVLVGSTGAGVEGVADRGTSVSGADARAGMRPVPVSRRASRAVSAATSRSCSPIWARRCS